MQAMYLQTMPTRRLGVGTTRFRLTNSLGGQARKVQKLIYLLVASLLLAIAALVRALAALVHALRDPIILTIVLRKAAPQGAEIIRAMNSSPSHQKARRRSRRTAPLVCRRCGAATAARSNAPRG